MEGSLKVIIGQLEDLFKLFNVKYYNGELQKPIIAVSPDVTNGAYGWCTTWKAWQTTQEHNASNGYYEINLCAEHLSRPFKEVCGTLLHEMVHLWNLQNNIKDTSRGGTYHNKRFKVEAEKRGLIIEQDEKYGWCITHLAEDTESYIEHINFTGFDLHRTKIAKVDGKKAKKTSSSRKYICPLCGQSIRATKELRVLCGECSTENELVLMKQEELDEE